LTGGGRLDRAAADLAFDLESSDLAALVELATGRELPGLGGGFAGRLAVAGDFAAPGGPGGLTARLELPRFTAAYGEHRIANLEPVVVRLVDDELVIDSIYVGEEGTGEGGPSEVFVAGTVGLGGEAAALALNVQSSLSAAWAGLVVPGADADGSFEVLATVRGTLDHPEVNGQGEIQGGRLILAGLPHALSDLTATVLFYPAQAVLDNLRADFAGGTLRAAGRLDLARLAAGEVAYRFQVSAAGVSVRYPEGFLLRGDANLTLVSSGEGRQIVGTADLRRAFYLEDVPVRVGQMLQSLLQRQRIEAGETDEALASTQLNLSVRGPGALRVRNNLADLRGDVDLTVRGTLANPVVFGAVEAEPGGTIVYADNDYRLERGLLTFANPHRIDPVIDLVAETEVRDYDVTLQLSGTLDRLDATFVSDPPLADLDVLALLTTGQTLGEGGQLDPGAPGAGGQGGAQTFLYGQAASVVTERVNRLFGFDQLRVNPIAGSGTSGTSVAFTVGKQLSRDLYVTYSRDPTSSLDYVLQAEWRAGRGVTLVLTQNGNRSYTVDLRWEKRF
jgi:translocation and assembly module TamB